MRTNRLTDKGDYYGFVKKDPKITRQVYNGPLVVKCISAIRKSFLVKNDIWTKELKAGLKMPK